MGIRERREWQMIQEITMSVTFAGTSCVEMFQHLWLFLCYCSSLQGDMSNESQLCAKHVKLYIGHCL